MSSGARGGLTASSRPAVTPASKPAHSTSSSRVSGKRTPSGSPGPRVVRAPDSLEERGDAPRRAHLADKLHRSDVDARARARQWQRGRAALLLSAGFRLSRVAASTGCRGGLTPGQGRGAPRARGPGARKAAACSRTRGSCGGPARVRRCGRGPRPSARWTRPGRARSGELHRQFEAACGGRSRRFVAERSAPVPVRSDAVCSIGR